MADLHEISVKDVPARRAHPSVFESLASGAVGGISLVIVGHPFDLVKVRLQTSTAFSGMNDAFRMLLAREGVAGIYRGVTAPLLGVAPIFAISIWGYDTGKKLAAALLASVTESRVFVAQVRADVPDKPSERRAVSPQHPVDAHAVLCVLAGGAFSALPASVLQVPGDRIKLRLQVSNAARHANPVEAAMAIWREGGWRSLYRGYWITLAREIPGSAIYFTNYHVGKTLLAEFFRKQGMRPDLADGASVLLAGGTAGTLNGLLTLPIDTVKSRFQAAPPNAFTSSRQVAWKLLQLEGPRALFRGLGPVLVRAFPANAACFSSIELVRHACKHLNL